MTRAIAKRPHPGEIVRASKASGQPGPPGGFTLGSTYLGGPLFTDAFGSRRAPSPFQLIEKYKSLIYAMVAKNANARCRVPLRLYADASRGSKPRSCCDPIKATRGVARRLSGIEYTRVSPSAVDDVHEIRTHPILDCLDQPDPYNYFDRAKILSLVSRYCDVVGSAYFMPEGNGWRDATAVVKGPPVWLWVLYSQYVLPIRMAGSPLISNFQYFAEHIPYEDLLWFRTNHSLRDPYGAGFSPTYAGDMYADLEDRFVAIQDQLLGIGPRPNLIATAKDPLQPPGELERKRFEQELRQKHSGGYAGGVLVNNGAWDFTPVTYSPADLAGMNISEYDMNRLCNIFGVPPSYFSTETNLANLQAADTQHARDAVEPWCTTVASQLTSLVRGFDNRLFFAFDACVPEDEELAARIVDMKLKNGSITINQANAETEWPPVEWGDEPWISNLLTQPTMLTEKYDTQKAQGFASVETVQTSDQNSTDTSANSSDSKQNVEKSPAKAKNGGKRTALDLLKFVNVQEYADERVSEDLYEDFWKYAINSPSYDPETGAATLSDCMDAHRLALGPPKEQAVNSHDKDAFWLGLGLPKLDNVIGDGDPAPLFVPPRQMMMDRLIERALERLEAQLS